MNKLGDIKNKPGAKVMMAGLVLTTVAVVLMIVIGIRGGDPSDGLAVLMAASVVTLLGWIRFSKALAPPKQ